MRARRGDRDPPGRPFLLTKYAAYLLWGSPGITLDSGPAPEAQLRPPGGESLRDRVAGAGGRALLAQHRAGVTPATMRVSWPGMPQDDILGGLELLGREVLPEVRRRATAG